MMVHGLVLPEENTTRSGPCGGDGADPRSVVLGEGGGVSTGGRVARARRSGVEESEEKLRGPDFLERDIPGPMQPAARWAETPSTRPDHDARTKHANDANTPVPPRQSMRANLRSSCSSFAFVDRFGQKTVTFPPNCLCDAFPIGEGSGHHNCESM